jgi:hypothetical protein
MKPGASFSCSSVAASSRRTSRPSVGNRSDPPHRDPLLADAEEPPEHYANQLLLAVHLQIGDGANRLALIRTTKARLGA